MNQNQKAEQAMEKAALCALIVEITRTLESVLELAEIEFDGRTEKDRLDEIASIVNTHNIEWEEYRAAGDAHALEALSYRLDDGWVGVVEGENAKRGTAAYIYSMIAVAVADEFRGAMDRAAEDAAEKTREIIEKACEDFSATIDFHNHEATEQDGD